MYECHTFAKAKRYMDWTCIFNFVIKLFIVCSSDCTSYPKEVVLGSLLDCMFVIPIITYFFIIRKRYSLTYIFPVVIAGYIFARFIIPSDYLQAFSYVSYIIVAGEIAFVCVELFLLYKIVRKLPNIIKNIKNIKVSILHFLMQLMLRLKSL